MRRRFLRTRRRRINTVLRRFRRRSSRRHRAGLSVMARRRCRRSGGLHRSRLPRRAARSRCDPISVSASSSNAPAAAIALAIVFTFVLDAMGMPIESAPAASQKRIWAKSAGSNQKRISAGTSSSRFCKRASVTKTRSVSKWKELLERVQGHPNVIRLFASGEGDENGDFIPSYIRDQVESEYMILEKLDMSLEERLKGSRVAGPKKICSRSRCTSACSACSTT